MSPSEMTAEIDVYRRELGWILDQMCQSLDGLTLEQISSRPRKSANSAFAVGNRVIGATTVYALGFGCGLPVARDREAEFDSAPTSSEELIRAAQPLR
jgi:hypothetical protein